MAGALFDVEGLCGGSVDVDVIVNAGDAGTAFSVGEE